MKTTHTGTVHDHSGDRYPELEMAIRRNFSINAESAQIFTTDATNLFDLFLLNLPSEARQHYTCNACRHFVDRFGGLVTIAEDGGITPVMWDYSVPSFFMPAVNAVIKAIERSKVTGVFLSSEPTLGTPRTGAWTHMSVHQFPNRVYKDRLLTAGQKMAEKREEFRMPQNALHEYSLPTIQRAVALLDSETLYRSEKVLGIAEWLLKLRLTRDHLKDQRRRDNVIWLAVGTAPSGFAHIRSSMIGTLLDDLQSGMDLTTVKRRFDEKMNPLKYQRPQAAPSAGNIAQAEKIVEKLGISRSLERRFARLDEIDKLWTPALPKQEESGGVFGHLKPKGTSEAPKSLDLPTKVMTWRKFLETVLPSAESIEYMVRPERGEFAALVTAEHTDAPPIIQWDHDDLRNPVSWYLYNGGSLPSHWNVSAGWNKVTAITYQPSMWYGENEHQGKSVFFILEGAKDIQHRGNALFPEILKSSLREVRSTIEAYSRSATLGGYEEASACGIRLQYGLTWNAEVRATTPLGRATYKLDRWD